MWKPFKIGRLEGEEAWNGKNVRGEVFAPTANPHAPKPCYWNVINFCQRGNGGLAASGYAATTDAAKAACATAMGL